MKKQSKLKRVGKPNLRADRWGRLKLGGWLLAGSLLILLLGGAGYAAAYRGRILPQVRVGSVSVGGMAAAAAAEKIQTAAAAAPTIHFSTPDSADIPVSLDELGVSYDPAASAAAALNYGRRGRGFQRLWAQARALVWPATVEPFINLDQEKYAATLENKVYNRLESAAQEVTVRVVKNQVEVVPGSAGLVLDHDQVERALRRRLATMADEVIPLSLSPFEPQFDVVDAEPVAQAAEQMIAGELQLTFDGQAYPLSPEQIGAWVTTRTAAPAKLEIDLDDDAILKFIKTLAFEQINREPADARIRFAGEKVEVFQPSQAGRAVREEESVVAVRAALLERAAGKKVDQAALAVAVTEPAVTENNLANLGIKELIGRAATDYATSPANRKHNIATGAAKMNGTVIPAGGEFSAAAALGEVDAAAGYLPELVISNNKLERQYGGGLCQPITTLFRAVLDAGLPVTDRSNHSRRVSYYEQTSPVSGVRIKWDGVLASIGNALVGYDATVYLPAPDLKFKNDTGQAILIQAYVTDNKRVTFEIYGTNDGRQVAVSRAAIHYTKAAPQPLITPDPTKPSNTMEQVEKPVPGAKTSFDYTITYPDGRAAKQTFTSVYRAIPAAYLVGTAQPTPLPETPPSQ